MKKFILSLFISLLFLWNVFAENIYQKYTYFWTKKCEIVDWSSKNKKIFAMFSNKKENEKKYYQINWKLYKSWKLYKNKINYLVSEFQNEVVYIVGSKIYKNDKIFLENINLVSHSFEYNRNFDVYYFRFYKDWKEYIFSNWKYILLKDFVFKKRYFSENKKYFIDLYSKIDWNIRLIKDWKQILNNKLKIQNLKISNNGKNYSFTTNSLNYFINWKQTNFKEVVDFIYSLDWKDLYFIIKTKDKNYIIYKNWKQIWKYINLAKNEKFSFESFFSKNNFYVIFTNWKDYVLLKNWKTIISFNSDIQIKLFLKKENWDLFIVERNKKLLKDIFYINWKKILEADNIDERFLNNWKNTFSIYPNIIKSNQYYTFVKNNWKNFLYVNWFLIPEMYDYLKLEDWLDNFQFLAKNDENNKYIISCKDITYLYPNLKNNRKKYENILLKLQWLSLENKENIIKKLENIFWKIIWKENKEILKMFLDNLKYK